MRVVLQRVKNARVDVDGQTVGEIGYGLLLYIGMESGDCEKEVEFVAEKILNLRVFPDENGRMNLSILDLDTGEILSVSQFTLASHISKGRRPDFNNALEPKKAGSMYRLFNEILSKKVKVSSGIFGAMMDVHSINDGPVTFIIEKKFEKAD